MLELELEVAYRDAPQRVAVRSSAGTFFAKVIPAGPFVAVVVPWDEPAAALEYARNLPGAGTHERLEVRER